ncbi:MAG TPA: AAA family ATPase [Longimicrobiaceae bacterium]|nr:AAA family ATPase [Longimicrobiaceae bacterium]
MQPHILLLNGPAGVGKSTVAGHLAELCPGTVCIHGDVLRGFSSADARSHLGPGSTYRAGAALAAAYLDMGAPRVIFEYVFEGPVQIGYFTRDTPAHVAVHVVTLWAPFDVIATRERQRPGRECLGARLEACYRSMEANLEHLGAVVFTTGVSPAHVAERLHETLPRGDSN